MENYNYTILLTDMKSCKLYNTNDMKSCKLYNATN